MTAKARTVLDLRKQFRPLYTPSAKEVQVIEVPTLRFLMTDGLGAPESPAFKNAIQTLYNLSYTLKFGLKKARGLEYPMMPLEGLWWTGERAEDFDPTARDKWRWTLMMMQPDLVTAADVKATAEEVRKKGRTLEPFRLEKLHEGLSVQMLHVGPYSTEASTIEKINAFMKANGYAPNGKHHEIYMGDPRRAAPSKLKTIVRRAVKRV